MKYTIIHKYAELRRFDHLTKSHQGSLVFYSKLRATKWLKSNTRKCGHNFHDVNDMNIEYIKCY